MMGKISTILIWFNMLYYLLQELKFTTMDFEYFVRVSNTNEWQLLARPNNDANNFNQVFISYWQRWKDIFFNK